jgi:hypothetical protein
MVQIETGWTDRYPHKPDTGDEYYFVRRKDRKDVVVMGFSMGKAWLNGVSYEPSELRSHLFLGPLKPEDLQQLTRLRDWKESAMTLLSRYDSIAETFGGKLGSSKIDNLEQGVKQLRAENERLALQLREWQEEKDAKAGYLWLAQRRLGEKNQGRRVTQMQSEKDIVEEARRLGGWAILAMPPSYGMPDKAIFDGAERVDDLLRALADEVEALRRGEFIC